MKILIADDDPAMRRILDKLLSRWGHAVVAAADGEEALRLLADCGPFEVAILDWMMPHHDGLEVCREIRERFNEPYVYVFLLTSKDGRDDVIQGLEGGADDYLIKPVHQGELKVRIRAAQRIIDLQAQLLASQERLRVQATHDALTGLWNRRAVFESLPRELARVGRDLGSLSLIMIDLDHFKRINDTYGHLIGDEVLRTAAERIGRSVRSYDTVGRYGGEEFIIVAPGFDADAVGHLAERLRALFDGQPVETSGPSIPLTISLGVITLRTGQQAELKAFLSAADAALYRAKEGGRNRCEVGQL